MDSRLLAADAAISRGERDEAVNLIIAALEDGVAPSHAIYNVLLNNLLTLKRYAEGAVWAEKATGFDPGNYAYYNYLGVCLRRTARREEALEALDRAIALKPDEQAALVNKGNIFNDMQDGPAAEAVFSKLVKVNPRNSEFQRLLGKSLWTQAKYDAAAIRFRQSIALQDDNIDAWLDLAGCLIDSGKAPAGLKTLDKAVARFSASGRILRAKANFLRRMGLAEEFHQFLLSIPADQQDEAWYHHEFGRLLSDSDRAKANEHFRRSLELDPASLDARMALVESLDRTRQGNEFALIEEAYRLLKDMLPADNLAPPQLKISAEILTRSADFEAVEQLGRFDDLGRSWARNNVHTALLGQMSRVRTADDRHELVEQHRLWGDRMIERVERTPIQRRRRPSSGKIRLGFMSSDLRGHPVTYFAWPLFEHADRDRFEIYCYSFYAGGKVDAPQQFVASHVDAFRLNPHISDHDAAQVIADDDLDILFELGGSTHMNKIEVMAWKPARLCASWLGYPHSAGLSTIDYLLVDPFLNPPDPSLLIEKPLVMPRSWIAMSPQAFPDLHKIEPVAPFRRRGCISFGTANNPYKYNVPMLRTWARIVSAVPGSRFIFVRPEAGASSFKRNILAQFEAEGVAADRIEFRAVRGLHMQHYNDIDITLDTFPQTGGTTTCEAAWMGAPTITLVGEALFERLSYSILQNADLGDLCARTIEDYVAKAVALAGDTDRLALLRSGLRDQLRASPLGQTERFAQDFYDLVAATAAR